MLMDFFTKFHLSFSYVVAAAATDDIIGAARNGTVVRLEPDPSTRGTFGIASSCLFTIFACTWSVQHLNVPGLGESTMTKSLRKLKWASATLIFPDFILNLAVTEWTASRADMEQLRAKAKNESLGAEQEQCGAHRIATQWTIQEEETTMERFRVAITWLRSTKPWIHLRRLITGKTRADKPFGIQEREETIKRDCSGYACQQRYN